MKKATALNLILNGDNMTEKHNESLLISTKRLKRILNKLDEEPDIENDYVEEMFNKEAMRIQQISKRINEILLQRAEAEMVFDFPNVNPRNN